MNSTQLPLFAAMYRWSKRLLLIAACILVTIWVVRAYQSRSLPDTAPWHTSPLTHEFRTKNYPDGIAFEQYLALEKKLDQQLNQFVLSEIAPTQSRQGLRYMQNSPLNPLEYETNWNWSTMRTNPAARGAVVLIHGASDSPYSLLSVANTLFSDGLNTISIRLPGHGTLPGELKQVTAKDWQAIVRSAVKKARQDLGEGKPIYLVGYSMGGALALDYALDSIEFDNVERLGGVVLISPAIAITPFAALANVDLLISEIPGLQKFAWNSISPEYDPYKYNSFPKQTGRQTYQLASSNEQRINKLQNSSQWENLPPVLTFMSTVDATVSVSAVIEHLYQPIKNERSSLVLFDVNRTNEALGFLENDFLKSTEALGSDASRAYDLILVSNRSANDSRIAETTFCAFNQCTTKRDLDLSWPDSLFSLSHVALPFSSADPIYGATPGPESPGDFTLGSLEPRGERGILLVSTENLMRLRYNPFLDYLLDQTSAFCTQTE